MLKTKQLKTEVDEYLKTRQPMSIFIIDLKQRVLLPQHEAVSAGTRYNVPLINALVLYVGMQAIQQLQSKTTTASFGQILARCPSQVSPQNKVTEDRGGSE